MKNKNECEHEYGNDAVSAVFLVPRAIEKYLCTATANELKVILYLFAHRCAAEKAETAQALSLSDAEVDAALAFWRGTGLIRTEDGDSEKTFPASVPDGAPEETQTAVRVVSETKAAEKKISYSSGELADAIERSEDVRSLLSFASQKFERILTPSEQSTLYALVDAVGLDCDLVMGIIEYCAANGKKSARYIERTATKLYEENGIDTYARFEEYLREKERLNSYQQMVRRIIGAEHRGLTQREIGIIRTLSAENVSEALLNAAYERTINNIAKPSLSYMLKIINDWLSKGIKSPEDIEPFSPPQNGKKHLSSDDGAFRLEDFTERPSEQESAPQTDEADGTDENGV